MRLSLFLPAALLGLAAAGVAQADGPMPGAVSSSPPSAAPVIYCPQVVVAPACRNSVIVSGTRSDGGVRVEGPPVRSGPGPRSRVRRSSDDGGSVVSSRRRGGTVYSSRTTRSRYVAVRPRTRIVTERHVSTSRDGVYDRRAPRYAGGYRDTYSGWGGRYGAEPGRESSGYILRYSDSESDRTVVRRREEGFGYEGGQAWSYRHETPPRVYGYERYTEGREGAERPAHPPRADRYGDRYDDDGPSVGHRRHPDADDRHGRDDEQDMDRDDGDDGDEEVADRGPRGHHGQGHHGRGHGEGGYVERYSDDRGGRTEDYRGRGGHAQGYHGVRGGSSYSSSTSVYGSSSSYGGGYGYQGSQGGGYSYGSGSSSSYGGGHGGGYTAYGARFYSNGADCNCGPAPVRGSGYYAYSQGENGALTWRGREEAGE